MYLENRSPLPLNINPQLTLLDDPLPDKNDQACRAAILTWSSARFFRTLMDGHLMPDMFHTQKCMGGTGTGFFQFLNGKGGSPQFETVCAMTPRNLAFYAAYIYGTYPLDMSQYQNLFQSTRVPMPGKDKLIKYDKSRHVVIQRGTEFWSLDVLDENGNVISADQILSGIQHILSTPVKYENPSVGILTTMDRNEWAAARSKIIESSANAESLEAIDSAMFVICLEDHVPVDYVDQQNSFLHGSAKNRWFDKSFQMIVQPNGRAGINFEHSWGDGVAVLRYFNEIYDDSSKAPCPQPQTHPKAPRKLEFKISNEVRAIIDKAEKDFDNTRSSVATHLLEVPGFTSSYISQKGLGLDGTLQMSFQLAYFRLFGHSASTYESANQSAFKHGRTETIRSATPESDAMCKTFFSKSSTRPEKEEALRKAVKQHGVITRNALMGKGWDRHMFALKHEALKSGLKTPAIFQDEAYTRLSEIILSTSTLTSPNIQGGGFGPVGPKCYGIGYTTGKLRGIDGANPFGGGKNASVDGFASSVMTYKNERDGQAFVDSMELSIRDICEVLDGK
uniref:Choline/carnitine acyltransferase domain-containing protein n=1 Tax=Guillardia theta TaxID=55529 RepID=A0A7S4PFT3_GUITH